MHDMFDLIINIIGTPCLGMSIVFTKIGFIHQMLQLSHINLHFNFKNSLQCIYLIINVIFTLLESISMNFKIFLLIFYISIFIKKYPLIYLRYIRYIHKMQVPIYPSKPIFPTLLGTAGRSLTESHSCMKWKKKKLMSGNSKKG